jgi:hypothetical protein
MAASAQIRQVESPSDTDKALAADLNRRFFNDGSSLSRGASLYTAKSGVREMKDLIEKERLPYPRFQRDEKTFLLSQEQLELRHAPALARVLERYGVGSEGHVAWEKERAQERNASVTMSTVLATKAVREGAYVDRKALQDGAVINGLIDQGVSPDKAALTASLNRAMLDGAPADADRNAVLSSAVAGVRADPDAVLARLESHTSSYGADVSERLERLDAYVRDASAHLGEGVRFSEPYPHDDIPNAVSLSMTDPKGHAVDWTMRFDVEGTSMPTHVSARGQDAVWKDQLMIERRDVMMQTISPYYPPSDTRQALPSRSPMEANGMKLEVSDPGSRKPSQDWRVHFEPGSTVIREILLDGRQQDLRQLSEMSSGFTPAARAVAKRLEQQVPRKPETVLFVPPSERADFESLVRQKGASRRYDPKVTNEFGRPGGFVLTGGDPADFARWQGREAHKRFVEEGDQLRRGPKDMLDAARYRAADVDGDPFARYMAQGVKMPARPEDQDKWTRGYTDARGRQHVGLDQATPDKLRDLASLTASTYQDLEREEARIRLSLAITKDTSWKTRYDKIPGSHEERIQALLPREAADRMPGFAALVHGQNRHLWTVKDPEAPGGVREEGLSQQDKQAMNALNRGFKYLASRFEELTERPLGFSLTSSRHQERNEQAQVDVMATSGRQNTAGFLGGAPATATPEAAKTAISESVVPARPAAAKPAPKRASSELDLF